MEETVILIKSKQFYIKLVSLGPETGNMKCYGTK